MNTKGHFGFYHLTTWWDNSFDDKEKTRFKEAYKPMGGSFEDLFEGPGGIEKSVVWFLTMLSGFLSNKSDAHLALKFLNKAEQSLEGSTIIDKHFLFGQLVETHYKLRTAQVHFENAKHYCEIQISIAPEASEIFLREFGPPLPSHLGYHQLAIILEKEKNTEEAIRICKQAHLQGWHGDWLDRIQKLNDRKIGA